MLQTYQTIIALHAYISNCPQCHIRNQSVTLQLYRFIVYWSSSCYNICDNFYSYATYTVITAIITYICVKRKFERTFKDKEQSKTVLYEQVGPSNRNITKNDVELQPNPAYGVSREMIMDTNPAYESCKYVAGQLLITCVTTFSCNLPKVSVLRIIIFMFVLIDIANC